MSWLGDDTLRLFGSLTPGDFLREFWQKKPLFIKNAVPEIEGLLDGGDLAGLALEDEVESRIVLKQPDGSWELRRGPFTEKTFRALPKKDWTLLVQAVDHFLPAAADLLDRFRFLPNWRIDDLMVSYAVDGGGVGPHYDSYDVFLIQGQGTRLWRVGPEVGDKDLLPHPDLRILKKMKVTEEFTCEPGDLLYLPPRIGHWGIAQGECMTFSVGFRAPSDRELLDGFCNYLVEQVPELQRYGDAGAEPASHPGALAPQAVKALRERIGGIINAPGALEDFLGRWLSEPKYGHHETQPPERRCTRAALLKSAARTGQVRRDEGSRFLLVPGTDATALYVDGERIPLDGSAAQLAAAALVTDNRIIDSAALAPLMADDNAAALVLQLFNSGHLYVPDATDTE